jgi:hypothetical protein
VDGGRDTGTLFGGRPVPVYIWYPVDSADISGATPEAAYPIDPYYGVLPLVGSSILESYGLDPAYQGPDPSSDAPFPLVMFSPGWGAPSLLHVSIGTRLASHGIAVAIVTHYGDGAFPWDPLHHIAVACVNRPLDLSCALDGVLARSGSSGDLLYGVVNPDQVAAAGWSLGGYAALALAGGDDMVCDTFFDPSLLEMFGPPPLQTCVSALPDTRFKAIVTLDGANWVLRPHELARITVPTLGIGQEFETAYDAQARQHAAVRAHPCYRVDLNNSIHWSFSDMWEAYQVLGDLGIYPPEVVNPVLEAFSDAIPPPVAHQLVNKYMIAFLKTQLARETGYQRILTPGWAIKREPDIEFFVTERMFSYFVNQPGSGTARARRASEAVRRIPHVGFMK